MENKRPGREKRGEPSRNTVVTVEKVVEMREEGGEELLFLSLFKEERALQKSS